MRFAFVPVVFVLLACSPCARATVHYVSATAETAMQDGRTWKTAFWFVSQASSVAQPGDEVWIAHTNLTLPYPENVTISQPNVGLYGGFAGTETDRSGRLPGRRSLISGNDVSRPLVDILPQATGAVVDGLDLANNSGAAAPGIRCMAAGVTITNNDIYWNQSGIFCTDGSEASVRFNRIYANSAQFGGGIRSENATVLITNNTIHGNGARNDQAGQTTSRDDIGAWGGGIAVKGGNARIANNLLHDNGAQARSSTRPPNPIAAYGGAIGVVNGDVTIVNNTIVDNEVFIEGYSQNDSALGAAIFIYQNPYSYNPPKFMQTTVANNIIARNTASVRQGEGHANYAALFTRGYANPTVRANLFWRNTPDTGNWSGHEWNIEADPLLKGYIEWSGDDYSLRQTSPAINAGDSSYVLPGETDWDGKPRIVGSRVDIGAYEYQTPAPFPTRVYVKTEGSDAADGTSWAAAKRTLNAAVGIVATGGEVWVAGGVYEEEVLVRSRITLLGGFAGTETERSQRHPKANVTTLRSPHIGRRYEVAVVIPDTSRDVTVDGFTFRHGPATVNTNYGRGLMSYGTGVVISNNVFTENNFIVTSENPTVEGAGASIRGGTAVIRRNVFRDNHIRLTNIMDYPTFYNSARALGGALYLSEADVTVVDNLFDNNSVESYPSHFSTRLEPYGGAIFASSVTGLIANNTIVNSMTSRQVGSYQFTGPGGGAVYLYKTTHDLTVANNIIAFNTSGLMAQESSAILSHNDVYGNGTDYGGIADPTSTAGNIKADPFFVDRAGSNYHLAQQSPAIDAGHNAFIQPDGTDLDGGPRIVGPSVDMGAYEAKVVTMGDAIRALKISAGLILSGPGDSRLNVIADGTSPPHVDLLDALALLRLSAGMSQPAY